MRSERAEMSRHRRSPLDDDDLLSEILLRLPPQPYSLPRASLVCKRWRGLASDPGFCRCFRIHHHFTAQLWKRKTDCNGVASWGLGRTVALDELLSLNSESGYLISIIGYAEENNLVFLGTAEGVFMIQL
uniref:F-box domain-containing protein n=1 Tax=Aegilops tauschii subsp. strangulata TaxID=200361 RepID=A0A453MZD7_AEGTS